MNITEPKSYFYLGQKVKCIRGYDIMIKDEMYFIQDIKVYEDGSYGLWATKYYYATEAIKKHSENGIFPFYYRGIRFIPVSEND